MGLVKMIEGDTPNLVLFAQVMASAFHDAQGENRG